MTGIKISLIDGVLHGAQWALFTNPHSEKQEKIWEEREHGRKKEGKGTCEQDDRHLPNPYTFRLVVLRRNR